jgi:outer membrane lipoprotein SlyB
MTHLRNCIAALALGFLVTAFVQGCASSSGRSYTKAEARTAQTVRHGTIVSVEDAVIEQDSTLLGPALGGVAGGVLGGTVVRGSGRAFGVVGGAAVGALTGAGAEKFMRTEKACEMTIELENGEIVSVVQARDDNYAAGDKVKLLYGTGGKVRVVRAGSESL